MTAAELPATALRVTPGRASGALPAPGSKSVTNRLLVLAALADGRSILRQPLDSDDTRAMRAVVTALGAEVADVDGSWAIQGTGGRVTPRDDEVDAGLSGTTMRFGAALAALATAPVTLTGQPPLLRRPVGSLSAALRALGAEVDDDAGFPPVRAHGGLRGGTVEIDVAGSSQFASAVLLVAPYAAEADVRVRLSGAAAWSYVELTVAAMVEWGADVVRDGEDWCVAHGRRYGARDVVVEYDASAAAHLFTVAVASGGAVTVTNAGDTIQADAGFPALCARMGAGVAIDDDQITVSGPVRLEALGDCDLGAMPDQLPNAAVLAALAEGESVLRNVAVVRGHETDRIAALARELGKLGVEIAELPDGLRIRGGVPVQSRPVHMDTYDDHRLAMAFAALASRVPGVVIEEPWCVRKTYPRFWTDLRRLGLSWEAA